MCRSGRSGEFFRAYTVAVGLTRRPADREDMRRRRRDSRVWSASGRAQSFGTGEDVFAAIGNPDRHQDTAERREYKKRQRDQYIADAPIRRSAHPALVCMKCWQKKLTDGSDGLGGFTPHGTTATGWSAWCRPCRAAWAKKKRAEKVELERVPTEGDAAASGLGGESSV